MGGWTTVSFFPPFQLCLLNSRVLQMYKGFDKVQHVQHIYTDASESLCGVKFDINKYQYLITGKAPGCRMCPSLLPLNSGAKLDKSTNID